MAINRFLGTALKVAQVNTVTVGGTLAGETFEISVGGEIIAAHTDTDTVIATTVAALVAAWNNSANPWATRITAVDASPDIVLTADVLGCPFEITLNTPGGIATFVQVLTTINEGPNVVNLDKNWELGQPTIAHDVLFDTVGVNLLWGIGTTYLSAALTLSFSQRCIASSKIGLDPGVFVISADGETTDPTKNEYRAAFYNLNGTSDIVRIGELIQGPKFPSVAGRCNLETGVSQPLDIINTAATSADLGRPSMQFKGRSAAIRVFKCDGGVGFGTGDSTLDFDATTIWIGPDVGSGRVFLGSNDFLINTKLTVNSGNVQLSDKVANTQVAIIVNGGILTTLGVMLITTFTQNGGKMISAHKPPAGIAITTANLNAGTFDDTREDTVRTFTTVNVKRGVKWIHNADVVTVTNLNLPTENHVLEIK